jgi:hypothetical protein
MATDTRKEAFLAKLEYILDTGFKKHYIYPMRIKNLLLVTELYSKINSEYTIFNMPYPLNDEQGNPLLNEDGEIIMENSAYEAQSELLEIALNDTYENISKWIDVQMIQDILDSFKGLSKLKKQIAMESKVIPPGEL